MLPGVYAILANAAGVVALIGTPPRIYRHGDAPQGVLRPYITWFVSSAAPANNLDDVPPVDEYTVQIDCWSEKDAEVEQLAEAVRDAIEPLQHLIGVSNGRDPETMRFRISLIFTFWTDRP